MIQDTSLEAYYSMEHKINDMQRLVLNIIKVYPGVSNREISVILHKPINTVTPRVKELRAMGFVKFHHDKIDRRTGRRVKAWEAVP